MKKIKKETRNEILFLAAVFLLLLVWIRILPFGFGPDESMRYNVADYIFRHGKLPRGDDPEIRNEIWGISYAFNPILSYMVSAVFMKIMAVFRDTPYALLMAARLVNALLGTGMAFLVVRIGKRLFKSQGAARFFTALVVFLPESVFVFSYVNNDGLALFATAMVILFWARVLEEDWTLKNCVGLAVGLGLLSLSYYNAYGWGLGSVLFFGITLLRHRDGTVHWKEMVKKGLLIVGIVFVIAGWWFIRNYILYDGDFLGQKTSSLCGSLYAKEPYKPENLFNGSRLGQGILGMFFYQDPGWEHNWLVTVAVSFVGLFGRMDVYMPYVWTKLYFLVYAVGIAAVLINGRKVLALKETWRKKQKIELPDGTVKGIIVCSGKNWQWKSIFNWCMGICMVIPFILLCKYSYSSDMQAQGRYILPMTIPFMYFITLGYEFLLNRFVKSDRTKERILNAGAALAVLSLVLITVFVQAPAY